MKTADQIWEGIGFKVINNVKYFIMQHYVNDVIKHYEPRLEGLIRKYGRYLPRFVAQSEEDDLRTVAQLELLETIKVWDPEKNDEVWPLARTRIVGAMKDYIRYLTKSDPSRLYDWIVDAAHMYMTVNDRADFQHHIETGVELNQAMECLDKRERKIVIYHTKKDMTFKTIGELIDVSESQVSRIYKKAIEKIKKAIQD